LVCGAQGAGCSGEHRIADPTSSVRLILVSLRWIFRKTSLILFFVLALQSVAATALADEVVVLLHGIANVPLSMRYLEERLEKEGFKVFNLGYPSTVMPIGQAADMVREKVLALGPEVTVHFVAHSMGNIVVRSMLREKLPNLGKIVMIAPPNQGSLAAEWLEDLDLYQWIFGPAGQELSADRKGFFQSLPIPPCPFGIIAGGLGTEEGFNPFLPGDDDGTLMVKETRLAGAADFILIKSTHTMILFNPETAEQVVYFLKYGKFERNSQGR
jgi:triacylglycerol lipase